MQGKKGGKKAGHKVEILAAAHHTLGEQGGHGAKRLGGQKLVPYIDEQIAGEIAQRFAAAKAGGGVRTGLGGERFRTAGKGPHDQLIGVGLLLGQRPFKGAGGQLIVLVAQHDEPAFCGPDARVAGAAHPRVFLVDHRKPGIATNLFVADGS